MTPIQTGRELDALVAEKIMGCKIEKQVIDCRDGRILTYFRCKCGDGLHAGVLDKYDDANRIPSDPWEVAPYSTSIADAWLVFCKFTSKYIWYDDATDIWHCHLDPTRRLMDDCRHHGTADEAEEAICITALKAVGYEVER